MRKKKLSIKLILFFLISFFAITFMHISFNAIIMAQQPSPNWSRSFAVSTTNFIRAIVADTTEEGDIIILSPVKDGKERLRITKLGKAMDVREEYEANIDILNINRINADDITLIGKNLYWRDNKENVLYTSVLDDDNKKFNTTEKLHENILDFDVTKDNKYVAVAFLDGHVSLYERINGKYIELGGPSDLGKVEMVNLKSNNNIVYLQTATFSKDDSKKEVYITEYKDNKWDDSLFMTSMIEIKNIIKNIEFAIDKDYVYSISSAQGDDKTRFTYIINGYSKENKELFDELKTRWAIDLKVYDFSSKPVMLDSDTIGITLFTTAPNNLDVRATNSNVIKLNLTKDGFNSPELVSNTKKWSNQVIVLRHKDIDNVLWNESGGFGAATVMGTSNDEIILNNNAKITTEDIKQAVAEEIPYLIHLLIILVGARFFSTLPSIIWLLCMFFWYNKTEKKYNFYLFIGMLIYLIFQLVSMDFYYQNINIMPEYITLSLARYAIPILFTVLGAIFAFVYKREADEPESYKVYIMFLLYNHILMNYLYVPYLF